MTTTMTTAETDALIRRGWLHNGIYYFAPKDWETVRQLWPHTTKVCALDGHIYPMTVAYPSLQLPVGL